MEYQFNFRITNKCNIKCRHCYCRAGPDGKTMDYDDAKRVINNLPENTTYLCITGGEPTIVPYFEKIITYADRKLPECELSTQTNGWWIKNPETLEERLLELSSIGLDRIRWSGADKYHKEQGIKKEKVKNNFYKIIVNWRKKYEKNPIEIRVDRGDENFKPLKTGRAENLPEEEVRLGLICGVTMFHLTEMSHTKIPGEEVWLNINPEGELLLCCYEIPPSLGNVIEKPVIELYKKALKNSLMKEFIHNGVRSLAKKLRKYSHYTENEYSYENCMVCKELFKDFEL